jgi:ParB family chromosome partitioning protein
MGRLDEMMKSLGGNIGESMGAGRVNGGAPPAPPRVAQSGVPARLQGVTKSKAAAEIPVAKIARDPAQPREEFDEESLQRLAESLKTRGQLQPIRVRWDEASERYVIVCGERRWRAAQMAGLETLSCTIVEGPLTPADLMAFALIENLLREDLRPLEQAKGFRALMEANGWSGNRLAQELGIGQPTVVKALSLLDLAAPVQEQVEQGALPPSIAYELSKAADADTQVAIAKRVVDEGLSRDETAAEVRKVATKPSKGRGASKTKPKGKPTRLPAELKHRGARGCRVVVHTTARHTLVDVAADLREMLGRIEAELAADGDQQAA